MTEDEYWKLLEKAEYEKLKEYQDEIEYENNLELLPPCPSPKQPIVEICYQKYFFHKRKNKKQKASSSYHKRLSQFKRERKQKNKKRSKDQKINQITKQIMEPWDSPDLPREDICPVCNLNSFYCEIFRKNLHICTHCKRINYDYHDGSFCQECQDYFDWLYWDDYYTSDEERCRYCHYHRCLCGYEY